MPRIELIPEVKYNPLDPIHHHYDNLPLENILRRINLINLALDDVILQMRDAIGTQGSLANRLNQSIESDGSLKKQSINDSMHSIEDHEDTDYYVRMSKLQSDKLDTISDNAKDISFEIYTGETTFVEFDNGILKLMPSQTVTPSFESPDILKLNMAFPATAAHRHYYSQNPVSFDLINPDYKNYYITSTSPAFSYVEDSLRVYINGVRIFEDMEVYVPGANFDNAWTLLKFTGNATEGSFELSQNLAEDDIIKIDFDTNFVECECT